MLPIFYKGYKKELEVSDMFETLQEHRSDKMGDKLEAAWEKERVLAKQASRDPSLLRALLREFGLYLFMYGCIVAVLELGVK